MYVKSQLFASMYTIGKKLAGANPMSTMTLEKMQALAARIQEIATAMEQKEMRWMELSV